MKKPIGAKCLVLSDSWDALRHYKIEDVENGMIHLRDFLDFQKKSALRTLPDSKNTGIFITPYAIGMNRTAPTIHNFALKILNISSSWIRTKSRYPVDDLLKELVNDDRLKNVPVKFIEGCVKSLVISEIFNVWKDNRLKNPVYYLELSPDMLEFERLRVYAGTFAGELSSLSDRVRYLVSHTGTVGTYRENLLHSLLRKNIPERYHVATGFIHRCPRQLDIVIYDRIDYAPLFREGDLVVVPAESVRAVIEVKTDLSKVELGKSLALLDQVSSYDDCNPPFFRGVFGFESKLSASDVYHEISRFYTDEPDYEDEENLPPVIVEPFQHVTSVCVLGHSYAQVDYIRDAKDEYTPTVVAGSSMTGLTSQAAFFLQHLLAYLRFGGLKPTKEQHIRDMLGEDTKWTTMGTLTSLSHWGPYFVREEMDGGDDDVEVLEEHIETVKSWLEDGAWHK